MKNVLLLKLLLSATIVYSQPSVQPVASGDYWQIDEYKNRLPELAIKTTFPAVINFTNGFIGINNFYVNKMLNQNEIIWDIGSQSNVSRFVVEWSRDLRTFERATVINLDRVEGGGRYVYRHPLNEKALVYYRIGIVTGANTIAYTPAVQVLDEEYSIKIFPSIVRGSTFYIETGQPFERMQVLNSAGQSVYEKGINGLTGTISIGLPPLATGAYYVRLQSMNRRQHVERIFLE